MNLNDTYIKAKENAAKFLKDKKHVSISREVPPGQRIVSSMVAMPPIISGYPHIPKEMWKLKVYGGVESPMTWDWEAFNQFPKQDYVVDFHCVTSWTKLGQNFTGVPFMEIVKLVKPKSNVKNVIFECIEGYTTNVIYQELLDNPAFIALKMDGADIEDKYGGPVRSVIPHLYGWKSAKHLVAIRFQEQDEPGFWEVRGYNNHADPWKEERYS